MSEVRRVLLANGQYIEIVQETGSSTGAVMSQNAVTAALNGKANKTHTHAATDITSGTFGSSRIADGAITSGKLAANAVTTAKVVDGAITKAKLASDVITSLPATSYETVIISASTTSGLQASAKGAQVQVNSVTYTFNTSAKIYVMIPYGQIYSVIPLSNGYAIPLSAEQTFTASVSTRSVSVSYTFNKGIYIEDKYGEMWNIPEWKSSNNNNANSIAVISNNVRFRVALTEHNQYMALHSQDSDGWSSKLANITENAYNDTNGAYNTTEILKLQPSSGYAAGWCAAYTFPDGVTHGYLPSAGEWYNLGLNLDTINSGLTACGGTVIPTYRKYWTSTFHQYSNTYDRAWTYETGNNRLLGNAGIGGYEYVLAIGSL